MRSLRPAPWQRWVSLAARLALAAVWLYAASTKPGKPLTSARAVQAYDIFPYDLAGLIGQALPVVELALGLLLLVGLFVRPVAILSGILLVVFIAGIASAWARGLRIDCGCFGGGGAPGVGPAAGLPAGDPARCGLPHPRRMAGAAAQFAAGRGQSIRAQRPCRIPGGRRRPRNHP